MFLSLRGISCITARFSVKENVSPETIAKMERAGLVVPKQLEDADGVVVPRPVGLTDVGSSAEPPVQQDPAPAKAAPAKAPPAPEYHRFSSSRSGLPEQPVQEGQPFQDHPSTPALKNVAVVKDENDFDKMSEMMRNLDIFSGAPAAASVPSSTPASSNKENHENWGAHHRQERGESSSGEGYDR